MKLDTILGKQGDESVAQARSLVRQYTNGGTTNNSRDLDRAVVTLLQDPTYVYNGDMYRIIVFDGRDLIRNPNMRWMVSRLREWDSENSTNQQYKSWSKTYAAAVVAVTSNWDAGFYDHVQDDMPIDLVLKQQGPALDVEKVLGNDTLNVEEQELLAAYHPSLRVHGFRNYNKDDLYAVADFKQLLADIKDYLSQIGEI